MEEDPGEEVVVTQETIYPSIYSTQEGEAQQNQQTQDLSLLSTPVPQSSAPQRGRTAQLQDTSHFQLDEAKVQLGEVKVKTDNIPLMLMKCAPEASEVRGEASQGGTGAPGPKQTPASPYLEGLERL